MDAKNKMSEFDTIPLFNPLTEQFMVRFNGEPYILAAKETKHFPVGLALHIAKHLSERCLFPKLLALKEKTGTNENPLVGQLINYDNPERRIALFDILGKVDLVESAIKACNLKGFIGEIAVYDNYVSQKTGMKVASSTPIKADIPIVNPEPTLPKTETVPEKDEAKVPLNSVAPEVPEPQGGRPLSTPQEGKVQQD